MKLKIGDTFVRSFNVTNDIVVGFAKYTFDQNPVHLDEEYAKNTMFKNRIAHGFLVGSFISAVLGNDFPGQGTIYIKQELNFKRPVFIDDCISVVVKVVNFTDRGWVELETICKNQDDIIVLSGFALVIPPSETVLVS